MTLNLKKKHVLFHVERSQQVLKTVFLFTTKESSQAELKKTFLERTQRRFGKFLFCSRNKSCFYKYSISQDIQTQELKSENTKPNLQELAQPKRDSAVEQKRRIVSSREI